MMKNIVRVAGIGAVLLLPVVALAQPLPIPKGGGLPNDIDDVKNGLLCNALSYLFTFAIIMGVVFLLIAAFRYVSSGGNQEQVKKVHQAVTYAIVGIAVAILAGVMPYLIGSFVGYGTLGNYCGGGRSQSTRV